MIKLIMFCLFIDYMCFAIFTLLADGELFFNPFANYEKWDSLNWFGVWTLTILYWIMFFPMSIILGAFYGIYKLFTIGRR